MDVKNLFTYGTCDDNANSPDEGVKYIFLEQHRHEFKLVVCDLNTRDQVCMNIGEEKLLELAASINKRFGKNAQGV